jgi:hypothetical protein
LIEFAKFQTRNASRSVRRASDSSGDFASPSYVKPAGFLTLGQDREPHHVDAVRIL